MAPAGPFEASVRACARVAIPRDRVFSFLLRPPLDPLLFISISTNFSSRTRRGYNKEEEQEEEEEDKGVSAARFGYWFRRILSSREQIFARSSLDIYVEEKGDELLHSLLRLILDKYSVDGIPEAPCSRVP